MIPRLVFCCCAVMAMLSLGVDAQRTPSIGNPHLPGPTTLPPLSDYIVVDDMLLHPDQIAADEGRRGAQTQGFPRGFAARFFSWDAGVVPYEIAPNFTDAQRQRVLNAMTIWSRLAPLVFVPRTTQRGFLAITKDDPPADGSIPSPCFAQVGQVGRATTGRLNLGSTCSDSPRTIAHEMGHSLGFEHEHQRADRDDYISIDLGNVPQNAHYAFTKYSTIPLVGPYDFNSVMHYTRLAFAIDPARLTILPHPPYQGFTTTMGTLPEPSQTDHDVMALLYNAQLRESDIRFPTESVKTRFDRTDLLVAMERLHAFYMSRMGLQRPQGLSIEGRPDFLGIAQWIFDIYLAARSGGFSTEGAFDIVVASITRTEEWRQKNPTRPVLTPSGFRPVISFNRDEFLDVLNRLDRFYAAPEGLQRPNGLSISGGPDFLGIATWIFDVYLNQRLSGASPNAAWTLTENAIRATDEWRSKH